MDEKNVPIKKIRDKNNRKNEANRLQENIFLEDNFDTSSDYDSNYIFFPTNEIQLFDIRNIRAYSEKQLNEKADSIKGRHLSYYEKILNILNENNTSSESDYDYSDDSDIDTNDKASTFCSSSILLEESDEQRKYYIKFKLYDNIDYYNNKKLKLPKMVQLDEGKYCYYYLNTLKTYYYTKSVFLGPNKSIIEDQYDLDESKLNEPLGLFFCDKNIEYNNVITKCSPNNMICKKCMEKNKKRYHLGNKYLININGRVAKKITVGNKDKGFHCFGHFSIRKQIENCLNKFTCGACELLNRYEKYYYS